MPSQIVYDKPAPGYSRRLRTLLANEEYGPKLVRLPARQQQTILQLINENRGAEARKQLTKLDTERRTKRAMPKLSKTEQRARDYAKLAPPHRTTEWSTYKDQAHISGDSAEFWALYSGLVH